MVGGHRDRFEKHCFKKYFCFFHSMVHSYSPVVLGQRLYDFVARSGVEVINERLNWCKCVLVLVLAFARH